MIIKNLEVMEKIVNKNKNLIWRGWDVIELKKTHSARTSKDGVYIKGIWYLQNIYKPDRNGWNIPNKFGG